MSSAFVMPPAAIIVLLTGIVRAASSVLTVERPISSKKFNF